ncbi:MAG: efflux transporter outer membrane subunit [Deltaproteobacteria bacterium]|nr:efflux transporter outer membrane subunit [Deltaproteobacteria bacterium]
METASLVPGRRSPVLGVPAVLLAAALAAGCTAVGRTYVKPALEAPASWTSTPEHTASGGAPDLATWWKAFGDPTLDALIDRAAAANLDLRVAQARVREARALRGISAAAQWPKVDAGATAQRLRDNLPPAPPDGIVTPYYQAGFDAAWELDLFGGVRRGVEAADADLGATVEEGRGVLVTVLAEVARNYVEARGLQRQLAVARETAGAQRETVRVTRARLEAGLSSEFDATRAEAQLAAFDAQIPALDSSLQRALHRLAVLLGQEPGALTASLSTPGPIPAPPPGVQVGLPSDLLLRRPDVRRAERDLAAATARIGVAEADLFPRLSLTGSFGFQSGTFEEFSAWSSRIWSFGPAVRWPLFEGGRVRANIRVQNARQEQALLRYERALLAAVEDVDNALVSYGNEERRRRSLADAVAASGRALATADALYGAGLSEYLQVLDAQRSLHAAQLQLVQSETSVASSLVGLYKALGGGWATPEASAGPSASASPREPKGQEKARP